MRNIDAADIVKMVNERVAARLHRTAIDQRESAPEPSWFFVGGHGQQVAVIHGHLNRLVGDLDDDPLCPVAQAVLPQVQ